MEKTADLTAVQKTVTDTLTREVQTPKVSADEAAVVELLPELDWPTNWSGLNPIENLHVPFIQ